MKPNNILNKILKLQGMTCCLSVLMSWLAMVTLNAQTVTQTMYIDFGANNNASRGMLTTGADSNGNYWTNVHCGSSSNYIFPGTVFDVVNSSNDNTGYRVVVNVRFTTNGKSGGGGLLNPSADLLGDLAVASATEDYIFPESHQDYVYFTFRGLDPNKGYRFYSFGSRTSTADRVATFVFQGENIWQGNHQMSGSGIGTDGSNANNSTIQVSDVVFPDCEGKITMTIVKLNKTGYVHLNAMKVEELSGLTRPNTELSLSQKMFIDFGEDNSDTRGHQTLGPDDNGNTWNNIYPASSNLIAQGTQVALVNAANAPTGITATTGANMKTNGLNNGGMNNPSAEWLGDMAVKTATEDYMFIETSVPSTTVNFTGMNKNNCYKFYFFGSRSTTTDRDCFYTLNGQREWSTVHITSGSSIGGEGINGNTMNIAVSDYVYPDADGQILFTMARNHDMAHINAIKIEEYSGGTRPQEPNALAALDITGSAVEGGSAPMTELMPKGSHTGIFETYVELSPGTYSLSGTTIDNDIVTLGCGEENGTIEENGGEFNVSQTQVVRVKVDVNARTITVTPVVLTLKGEVVPDNTTLNYDGNGVWKSTVTLNKTTTKLFVDRQFYFTFNGTDELAVKRVVNTTNKLAMPGEGFSTENIRVNNNTYTITVDMRNYLFAFDAPVDEHKISVFGSSVSNGQGATNNHGYAYMYDELLQSRFNSHLSTDAFRISGVAINGNNTVNLLNRYDDLARDFGKYVIFGLSLGNEGIHGAANQENIFAQFRDNMLSLIAQVRADGKVPVIMNNYTRTDFTESDYAYIKRMNLLIHEWDLPSVNMLGAIDDGTGKWAAGYQNPGDIYHPTTAGHREFYYAMVPSLFDAIAAGKPLPVRNMNSSLTLKDRDVIEFEGEETIHPFALSMRVKGKQEGNVASFTSTSGSATISVEAGGKVVYHSPSGSTIVSSLTLDNDWHYVTLSHYWAQKRTLLFVDGAMAGELSEQLVPTRFSIGDNSQATERQFSELFFWRSALNAEEVNALVEGKMLKSSLDIYATLADGETNIVNKAQSMNTLVFTSGNASEELPGLWIIGANGSVGMPNYGEGDDWNTDNAIRMQALPNNIYKVALTVGESLNKDFVNFKFFGQPGWGVEFLGDGSSDYNVTSDSDMFGIDSTNESNGNVYLMDGQTLTDGDTYIFFLDCSQGYDHAVMHVEKRVNSVNGIWIIGANGSVGEPSFTEGDDWNADNALQMTEETDGIYTYTFTVGENLNKDFVNFKFFGQAGWGVEYKSTGTVPYLISSTSDIFLIGKGTDNHGNGNVYLADGQQLVDGDVYIFTVNTTQGADNAVLSVVKEEKEVIPDVDGLWIIGANGSVGVPNYTEGSNWETSRAIAMTEIADKVYEFTFTVGETLNKSFVNFKFFGQAGWGIEFLGCEGALYHLTSESDVFLVGNGSNGHDDGNIYLASGATLTDGDKWTFTVDCSKGYRKSVLKVVRAVPTVTISISQYGYASYCGDKNLNFAAAKTAEGDDASITAYAVTHVENGVMVMTEFEGGYKAGEGAVLKGGQGTYEVPVADGEPNAVDGNLLVGNNSEETITVTGGDNVYRFGYSPAAGKVGFMKATSNFNVGAGKAYLKLADNASAALDFLGFDNVTGISMATTDGNSIDQLCYNLNGQPVNLSYRGVVIMNGKKYLMK